MLSSAGFKYVSLHHVLLWQQILWGACSLSIQKKLMTLKVLWKIIISQLLNKRQPVTRGLCWCWCSHQCQAWEGRRREWQQGGFSWSRRVRRFSLSLELPSLPSGTSSPTTYNLDHTVTLNNWACSIHLLTGIFYHYSNFSTISSRGFLGWWCF